MLTKEEIIEKTNELKNRASSIHEKVMEGIEGTMGSTAETLDMTAEKMHETANYLRDKNFNHVGHNMENMVKKYPLSSVLGSFVIGFLIGKIILR